jgi:hypothetical protein
VRSSFRPTVNNQPKFSWKQIWNQFLNSLCKLTQVLAYSLCQQLLILYSHELLKRSTKKYFEWISALLPLKHGWNMGKSAIHYCHAPMFHHGTMTMSRSKALSWSPYPYIHEIMVCGL